MAGISASTVQRHFTMKLFCQDQDGIKKCLATLADLNNAKQCRETQDGVKKLYGMSADSQLKVYPKNNRKEKRKHAMPPLQVFVFLSCTFSKKLSIISRCPTRPVQFYSVFLCPVLSYFNHAPPTSSPVDPCQQHWPIPSTQHQ